MKLNNMKFIIKAYMVAKIADRAPQEVTKLTILKADCFLSNTAGASFNQLPASDNEDFSITN